MSLRSNAIPETGQSLMNISPNELISGALDLVSCKSLVFRVACPGLPAECHLDVQIDPYNSSYLEDRDTGSRAWFRYDGNMLFFIRYSGSKKTFLFHLFMALYKQAAGYYPSLSADDEFTPDLLFGQPLKALQDFAAPFGIFLKTSYSSQAVYTDNELSPSKIILRSTVEKKVCRRSLGQTVYEIHLDNKGIEKMNMTKTGVTNHQQCTGESLRES